LTRTEKLDGEVKRVDTKTRRVTIYVSDPESGASNYDYTIEKGDTGDEMLESFEKRVGSHISYIEKDGKIDRILSKSKRYG
jgi:hypothetical protein